MKWITDARGNYVRADLIAIVFVAETVENDKTIHGVIGQLTIPGVSVVFEKCETREEAEAGRNALTQKIAELCC